MSRAPFHRRDWSAHPPADTPDYRSTALRAPRRALTPLEPGLAERSGPTFAAEDFSPLDNDLIRNYAHAVGSSGEAIGERIVVFGRVMDDEGRPVRRSLVEIWQANAGGRYRHVKDGYCAPLDPNFGGCGRVMTDDDGRYFFRTIRPGPYPWPNRGSEWRPAHIHLSLFGEAFAQRLVTQLYFEGDPLIARCPIVNTLPDRACVERLVARLDLAEQQPYDALAYRFDIVLRGRRQSFFENRMEGL